MHGKSLRLRAGQTCSLFWVTTGGELEKVFSSPRHLIRPEKIGSCVLHLPFADSPLRSLGNSLSVPEVVDESAPEVVGEVEEGKENAVLLPCCLTRNPRVVVGG